MLAKLAVIDKAFLSKLGRFMGMLQKTAKADGSLLDRTVVLYGSGMNSGKGDLHSPKNLPLLVAGGSKAWSADGLNTPIPPTSSASDYGCGKRRSYNDRGQ